MSGDSLTFTEVFRGILNANNSDFEKAPVDHTLYQFTKDEFESALHDNEFVMYYQPKVRAVERTIEGAEALLRWNHPQLGVLTPDKFLLCAESTTFIHELGAWVVRQVSRCNAMIRDEHKHFVGRIALNVSPSQFNNPAYLSAVLQATAQLKFPNHLLEIELTETGVLQDLEHAAQLMGMIRSYGISIAIDDFGTGFSSMQNLARLPINTVKLDISFIRHIESSEVDRKIVRSLLSLCRELELSCVAEGVENEGQADILTEWGCDYLQGFLFSPPLPEENFINLIR